MKNPGHEHHLSLSGDGRALTVVAPAEAAREEGPQNQLLARGLQALRRRWLPAMLLGLLCGGAAAAAVWKTQPKVYTAVAILELSPTDASLLDGSPRADAEFGLYKQTQRELVGERSVVEAALLDSRLAELDVVKRQPDSAAWLAERINVSFPGDAQIMHVSLTLPEKGSVAPLVNGVVNSYLDNVVRVRRNLDLRRKDYLERAYGKLKSGALQHRRELDSGEESGAAPGPLAAHQTYLNRRLNVELQQAELEAQLEEFSETGDADAGDADAGDDEAPTPSERQLAEVFASDALLADLQSERDVKWALAEQYRRVLREGSADPQLKKVEEEVAVLDESIEERKQALTEALVESQRGTAAARRAALERQLALLERQEQQFRKREQELWEQVSAQRKGPETAERALAGIEAGAREAFLQELAADLERLDVETQLDVDREFERVRMLSPAKTPALADDDLQLQLTAAGGVFGFFVPFALVLLDDLRRHRIGATSELEELVELELMGTVPFLPPEVLRKSGGDRDEALEWRQRLKEAVDRVAAVLLRRSREHDVNAVLVTSAVQGEGKSTLAAQIAVALASFGRRTLLVDADLRRPRLHDCFSLELSPGLTDVLGAYADVETSIRPTQFPNLSVLPAGEWRTDSLAHLTSEASRSLFARLKEDHEFVIVDGSPVLQTVDPRLLGQCVDGVVISLLRDVSTMPQLREACRVLRTFEIPLLGTVMAGTREQVYYRYAPKTGRARA